jgi:heavy metal sensor kinase
VILKALSVRVRLTLWYVSVLAAIILGFALGVYLFLQASLLQEIDNHLARDFVTVEREVRQGRPALDELTRHGNVSLFRVTTSEGPAVETDAWRRAGLKEVPATGKKNAVWSSTAVDGQPYRIKAARVESPAGARVIAVAHDGLTYHQSMRSLTIILLLAIPAALVLAVVGGYFLAGRVLSPLAAMAATAREITADRLSERLPVENPEDEFGRLAMAFNETFLRLEDSFDRLHRFTADASHELRTPLTAIRSVGEVGLQEAGSVSSCREVIGSMLEEADRLTKLVDSLLLLSRADARTVPLSKEKTDLALLATEVSDCLQVLAEEKEQTLSVAAPQPVFVVADRTTLRQALINLLDNAIKYTPAKGYIQVAVETSRNGEAIIAVSDDGPGIPAEHRTRIYERFYRVDKGRSREIGGAGLGLSIAQWAVNANNGRLELESRDGKGSTFKIHLPLLH